MHRFVIVAMLLVGFILGSEPRPAALAQEDADAITMIRGENIWLRAEPTNNPEVVTILQRGDEVRITGDAVLPNGDTKPITATTLGIAYDIYVPIEVLATGETGWVSEIYIDPRIFVSVGRETTSPAAEPADDTGTADAGVADDTERGNRRNRRQNQETPAETTGPDEAGQSDRQDRRQNRNANDGTTSADDNVTQRGRQPQDRQNSDPTNEIATSQAGTLDDPADIGSTLTYQGLAVTVTNAVFATEFDFSTPKGGYKFLVVDTRLENLGDEDHNYNYMSFSAQDARSDAGFDSVFVFADDLLDSGTLSPGEYVTGKVFFEVQETTRRALVKFDPDWLTEEDLYWSAP